MLTIPPALEIASAYFPASGNVKFFFNTAGRLSIYLLSIGSGTPRRDIFCLKILPSTVKPIKITLYFVVTICDILLKNFGINLFPIKKRSPLKGSLKNNLVEFAPEFSVDLIDLIAQIHRNSELFRGLLQMKIG